MEGLGVARHRWWRVLSDDGVWRRVALRQRGEAFWARARQRPAVSSRPLGSWRSEVLRLAHFDHVCVDKLGSVMGNAGLYLMWEVLDAPRQRMSTGAI